MRERGQGFGVACDWVGTRANGVQTGGRGRSAKRIRESASAFSNFNYNNYILKNHFIISANHF